MTMVMLAGQPHVLLVVQDVTERNLLERQLRQAQKMEAIGQLAAGVAHDFNNILTVIQGHAGLIKNQIESGRPPIESAEKISKAANRASSLIRQLLMFSRKQVMRFQHLDLNESVNNSLAMVARLVGEHIELKFDPGAFLPSIHADPTMLEQVIMNLAVNARDAMENGGTVRIATELVSVRRDPTPMDPVKRDGQFVRLIFTDTGCGMDTSILNRIFEPFFTTKGIGKGTGLGLSTVFGIMRQHEGWIEVNSLPNKGTTFHLNFPASEMAAEKTQNASDTGMLLRGRETVLVAEDEDALREMVSLVLTAQGYKVLVASSGVEALKIYEQASRPIDLLLTDMVMPGGILGGELAERLKAQSPGLKVIYTSGYSPGMAGKDISLLEGRNFLPKPYTIGKLAQFVRECLDAPGARN
jgi:nitrogen-specific signal transduction histidine kinase/ActR/RegA family two-component response regulator